MADSALGAGMTDTEAAAGEVAPATFAETVEVLREWGSAIRGDWGSIDGRSSRAELCDLADQIEMAAAGTLTMTLSQVRSDAGICPSGGGHWTEWCDSLCARPAS